MHTDPLPTSSWIRTSAMAVPRPLPTTGFDAGMIDRILEPGTLSTLFQPIFDLTTATPVVVAVESLTRGPQGSSLEAPNVLFEFARRKRAEAVVDRAAIATALAAAAPLPGALPLHLNVHASTLSSDATLVHYIERIATYHGVAMSRLTIEIVEHAEMVDDALLAEALDAFRRRGVGIALDDIGHGRSNFRMMLLARPGMLKVDRYLMQGIAGDPIRRTIVGKLHEIASTIPAVMVAEGIETLEDLAILRELGVEAGQGYLFARPMSAAQLAELPCLRQLRERTSAGCLRPLVA